MPTSANLESLDALSEERRREYVREIQRYLRTIASEFPEIPVLAVDGIFGPKTAQAVRTFQREFGLPVTGTVDLATWNALYSEFRAITRRVSPPMAINGFFPPDRILREGDTGDSVMFLQTMINALADVFSNIPKLISTGEYNSATADAVFLLQQIARLPANGFTDRQTWDAIVNAYNSARR